jgi:hypothetical protein
MGEGSDIGSRFEPRAGKYSTTVRKVTVSVVCGLSPVRNTCKGENPDGAIGGTLGTVVPPGKVQSLVGSIVAISPSDAYVATVRPE